MLNINNQKIQRILAFFFLNNKRRVYLTKLGESLNIDKGNLSRYLSYLVKEGILKVEEEGRQKYFSLNSSYRFLSALKKMAVDEIGPEYLLKKRLAKLPGLENAYIFGSYAAGHFNDRSDIDLLLIGSHSPLDVYRELGILERDLDREINVVDYSRAEYEQKIKEKDGFLAKVMVSPKIVLK